MARVTLGSATARRALELVPGILLPPAHITQQLPAMASSLTISASAAARASAPKPRSHANGVRGPREGVFSASAAATSKVTTAVRLGARTPGGRRAAKGLERSVTAAGLPPNLQGMMGNMDPEKLKEIQEAYAKAMKDPETAKKVNAQMAQMQGLMNNPMVQKQMQAMNNMIAVGHPTPT